MARPKKYSIHLTEKELKKLKSVIRKKASGGGQGAFADDFRK